MKVIAVQAMKGGTGKTLFSITLASALANPNREGMNRKVLLVDTDEQCNACFGLGLDYEDIIERSKAQKSSAILFTEPSVDMNDLVLTGVIPELPNLYLIPSDFRIMYTERELTFGLLPTYTEYGTLSKAHADFYGVPHGTGLTFKSPPKYPEARMLRKTLEYNRKFLEQFDYVIFDCKPSLSNINENILAAADSLIVVSDPSYDSLYGTVTLYSFWNEVMDKIDLDVYYTESIILNRFRRQGVVDREIEAVLREDMSNKEVPDYDRNLFKGYKDLYVDCPLVESAALKKRSIFRNPIVVNPDKNERSLLDNVIYPLIDKLYEREAL